jgi:hypothetical protein
MLYWINKEANTVSVYNTDTTDTKNVNIPSVRQREWSVPDS